MDRLSALVVVAKSARQRDWTDTIRGLRTISWRSEIAGESPRHLQVEIITHCNLGCIMCPRTVALARAATAAEEQAWHRRMPYEEFLALLRQFPRLLTLSLHGIGEPLMHPHLFEMVAAAAEWDIQVRFTTNATLLDRDRCLRLIESGLHRLIVSLDGASASTYEAIRPGAKFERVVENLRVLTAVRRKLRSRRPRIELSMVVQKGNASEAAGLVRLAHDLGVNGVTLSPMKPPVEQLSALECDPDTWRRVTNDARRTARALGIPLFIRGGRAPRRRSRIKPTYRCMNPWLSTVVTLSGDVMPCCNIHEAVYSMGNTSSAGFAEIWNGARYREFRRSLLQKDEVPEPCRSCPEF